jgi:VIT1/CCC1 family predicted Fe2+/Mn2+ transporter
MGDEMGIWVNFRQRVIEQIRSIIFGLGDSLVSTTGAVTGIAAGSRDQGIVILSGLVVICVESISMSAGEYLSSKSEQEVHQEALDRELHEIRTNPESEKQELIQFYRQRGFSDAEIEIFINRIMENEESLLEEMAHQELQVPYPPKLEPGRNAWYIGISYLIGGMIPIIPYLFLPISWAIPISNLCSFTALFIVGVLKGKLVRSSPLRSGIEMLLISMAAALVGYGVGRLSAHWLH